MKRNKRLAIVAAMVFAIAALAGAQEGYSGQQAAAEPAVQSQFGNVPAIFAENGYSGGGEGYYGQANQSGTRALKVGKAGRITLAQAAKVGNTTLSAGDYEVRHRRSPNGHFVEFTRVVDNPYGPAQTLSPYEGSVVADVPCTMRALSAPVTRTAAELSRAHLNSLRIRGGTRCTFSR